jgi:hypothetical protein
MTFNVGDMVRYSDFQNRQDSELPEGTVLLFPSGTPQVLGAVGDLFIFKGGVMYEFGDMDLYTAEFKVLHLPETPTKADPIQDLAQELWEVRNESLADDFPWLSAMPFDVDHKKVYTALAKHVMDKYAVPVGRVLQDKDGDCWHQNAEGTYDLVFSDGQRATSMVGYSRDKIEQDYAPLVEVSG